MLSIIAFPTGWNEKWKMAIYGLYDHENLDEEKQHLKISLIFEPPSLPLFETFPNFL